MYSLVYTWTSSPGHRVPPGHGRVAAERIRVPGCVVNVSSQVAEFRYVNCVSVNDTLLQQQKSCTYFKKPNIFQLRSPNIQFVPLRDMNVTSLNILKHCAPRRTSEHPRNADS